MKPKILHTALSASMRTCRLLNRVMIWHTLHRTYVDCFEQQIPCPPDASGMERQRWQEACRIEELRWQISRPAPQGSGAIKKAERQ